MIPPTIPPNGMSAAKAALRYWERRQEVVANNLANVSTDGFKAERAFARLEDGATPVAQTATDLGTGTLRATGNPLDVALGGEGFVVVRTTTGERWSRAGSLQLNAARELVDQNGNPVLGSDGPIVVPDGIAGVEIDRRGVVRSAPQADRLGRFDGERAVFGTLRLETAPRGTSIAHEGDQYFLPTTDKRPLDAATRDVRQGFVEDSNVSPTQALVEMITIQRHFAFAQKALSTLDDARGKAVNDLGKPV
jgi:flagellar basal body rod protein FlgG